MIQDLSIGAIKLLPGASSNTAYSDETLTLSAAYQTVGYVDITCDNGNSPVMFYVDVSATFNGSITVRGDFNNLTTGYVDYGLPVKVEGFDSSSLLGRCVPLRMTKPSTGDVYRFTLRALSSGTPTARFRSYAVQNIR